MAGNHLPEGAHSTHTALRILAISALWHGANDYAFVRAFRRAGHSVRTVSTSDYVPAWQQSACLRFLRRLLRSQFARAFNQAILSEAKWFRPDLFFVFKGELVFADTLRKLRARGIVCIQFYPDTGFTAHSTYLSAAVREYDWFFSTKPEHENRLPNEFGMENVSFLAHAFDPETHEPPKMSASDWHRYGCDLSFIGTVSAKKCQQMEEVCRQLEDVHIRIWGSPKWSRAEPAASVFQGGPVFGTEYAKAICASRINLALLYEGNADAAEPDVVTARTFEIPASGGFMLHERTEVAMRFFEDGKDCAFFSDSQDLVEKARYYLDHEEEREAIAASGRKRCLNAGYSVDDRVNTILSKFQELRAG